MTGTTPCSAAYEVPFWVDRRGAPHLYTLVNVSDQQLRGVRVTLLGSGVVIPMAAALLDPGAALTLTVVGPDVERDSVAVVRWFRPDGVEYLWRFSF